MSAQENNKEPSDARKEQILLEQYKILEERRMYFGRQFMQTAGFVGFTVAVRLISQTNPTLLNIATGFGGVVFLLMSVLSYRLGVRQDHCEEALTRIEEALRNMGHSSVASLHPAATFGARKLIVGFFAISGVVLLVTSLWRMWF